MSDMTPPTFYLETSVLGSLASRQPRHRRRIAQDSLRLQDGVRGVCVVSAVVIEELEQAPPAVSSAVQPALESADPTICPVTDAVKALAQAYLEADVLPKRRAADALHVAAATCFELAYLVSWNHRHLTRPSKKLQYASVNLANGYPKTPLI
jgi:predicted nucleic acid-binding protein